MNRKIGIIGGVGPQSTNYIYQKIIEISQSRYGAKNNADYPKIAIESVPVPDFISDKKNLDNAKEMLKEAVDNLSGSGVTRLCIGSNTVHILLDDLRKEASIPFISIIEEVAKKCVNNEFKKVAVLGTPILVESGLYTKELEDKGIRVLLPDKRQLKEIEEIIRSIIAGNKPEKIGEYEKILYYFLDQGAQAIILGCTELPLVMNYSQLKEKIIDTDAVLAESIANYFYAK